MGRITRISEGSVTAYGKQVHDPLAVDAHWRSRISSEGVGVRKADSTGASTAVSMLWCPRAEQDTSGKSQRRTSELKVIQDLGLGLTRPLPAGVVPVAPLPSPSHLSSSSHASHRSGTSVDTTFLTNEEARLQVRAQPLPSLPVLPGQSRCAILARRPRRMSASSGKPTCA